MKRFFTVLLLSLAAAVSWAGLRVVVFDPSQDGDVTLGASAFTIVKEGVSLSFSNGLADGSQYRVYKNQTLTVCTKTGDIVSIEFQCTAEGDNRYGPGGFVANAGEYSIQGKVGNWQGRATCVTFTAANSQVRLTRVVVTIDDDAYLAAPVITPSSGVYYEPFEAFITCSTAGATIRYTTDGSDPDEDSPEYLPGTPIVVNSDMTLKAVSMLDGEVSEVVAATYQFMTLHVVTDIAAFQRLPEGTAVRFSNPVIVLAQNKNYLYVKDESGYAFFYGYTGQTYRRGDVIPPGFTGEKDIYSGEPELNHLGNFQPATDNVPVSPVTIGAGDVSHAMFAQLVRIDGATFMLDEDGRTYSLMDENGDVCPVYFGTMGVSAPAMLSATYDVEAIVGSYKPREGEVIYQLLPVSLASWYEPTLCDVYGLEDNVTVTFAHEIIALHQVGNYLYVKDGESCYGLLYGPTGQTYSLGDVIPPGWGGTKTTYNGFPELSQLFGFQPASRSEVVNPQLVTIPQVKMNLWAHYVELRHVRIDQEHQLVIDMNGNSIPYAPQLPYTVDPDGQYTVRAIVVSYGMSNPVCALYIIWTDYVPPVPKVCCISDLADEHSGQVYEFECPLTVIYQQGDNLYVKDSCGDYGLMFGNGVGGPFQNGDHIVGKVTLAIYGNDHIFGLIPQGEWTLVGKTDPVEPEVMNIEDVAQDMCHWYLRFENVTFRQGADGNIYIGDETDEILVFGKFPIVLDTAEPCDVNGDGEVGLADVNHEISLILTGGAAASRSVTWPTDDLDFTATYDVDGFLTIYNGQRELYPVRIARHGTTERIPGDVNGDGEVNLADVNIIIDSILSH